jgi:hypothetical protein
MTNGIAAEVGNTDEGSVDLSTRAVREPGGGGKLLVVGGEGGVAVGVQVLEGLELGVVVAREVQQVLDIVDGRVVALGAEVARAAAELGELEELARVPKEGELGGQRLERGGVDEGLGEAREDRGGDLRLFLCGDGGEGEREGNEGGGELHD